MRVAQGYPALHNPKTGARLERDHLDQVPGRERAHRPREHEDRQRPGGEAAPQAARGGRGRGEGHRPRADRVTIKELADDLKAEYAANGRRSAERLDVLLRASPAGPGGGASPAPHDRRGDAYTVKRQQAGAANATINRELAALKRLLRLAAQGEKITRVVHINMLREDNVRRGFFEREQFEAVRRHLPEALRPVASSPTSRAGGSARSWGCSGTGSTSPPAPCGSTPAPRRAGRAGRSP